MPPPRLLFFGTPEFAAVGLRALLAAPDLTIGAVVTQPDRPAGRGQRLHESPVKRVAIEHRIPVIQPERIRNHEADFIAALAPYGPFDLGVVIAFGQILPQKVLDLPAKGCVNLHGSILPRWRGAAPIQRALMSGDAETGVCLMGMEAGLDTGPVFSEERLPIGPTDTFLSLHDKLAELGARLLLRDLPRIITGSIRSVPQSERGVTYAQKIESADRLIDWSTTRAEIERRMRALDPAPGASTYLEGRRVKLFQPKPIECTDRLAPGEIRVEAEALLVGCADGLIAPQEVQPEGKRRMKVAEWLKGTTVPTGSRFSTTPGMTTD